LIFPQIAKKKTELSEDISFFIKGVIIKNKEAGTKEEPKNSLFKIKVWYGDFCLAFLNGENGPGQHGFFRKRLAFPVFDCF
jgi:hypothetical protein